MRSPMHNREIPDGSDWDEQLRKLYEDKGLISGDKFLTIHKACEQRDVCWKGSDRHPTEAETTEIMLPWKGFFYDRSRILSVAENANLGGDHTQLIYEVLEARGQILEGKRRVFGKKEEPGKPGSGYGGTNLHYCLGVYAATLLSRMGIMGIVEDSSEPGEMMKKRVSEAFDFIAFTEHVKCWTKDPEGQERRGKPLEPMWEQCGKHILQHEIKLLKPKIILIMGIDKNFKQICNIVGPVGPIEERHHDLEGKQFIIIRWTKAMNNQLLVGVRHPQAPGGPMRKKVCKELSQIDLEQW